MCRPEYDGYSGNQKLQRSSAAGKRANMIVEENTLRPRRRKTISHLILRAVRSTASRRMTTNDNVTYLKIIPARVGGGVAAGGAAGWIEKVSQVFQPAGRFWLSNSK